MSLKRLAILACLSITPFIGCDSQDMPSNPDMAPDGDVASESTSGAPSEDALGGNMEQAVADMPAADSASQAPPAEQQESSPYLPLPENADQNLAQMYEQMQQGLEAGDPIAQIQFAIASHQIGVALENENAERAMKFYRQSAPFMLEGLENFSQSVPAQVVSPVLIDAARAFAKEENQEQVETSLRSVFLSGYTDVDSLKEKSELQPMIDDPEMVSKIEQWQDEAKAVVKEKALAEMEASESFPFEFTLPDTDGESHSLSQYEGKVVIADVWGTWCPPCREEIPSFIKLQEEYGDQGFQMIGLNYERANSEEAKVQKVVDYIDEVGINYPCLMGDDETREQIPNFRGFPTTLFIDKTGKVRLMAVGLHEYSYLEAVVKELLAE